MKKSSRRQPTAHPASPRETDQGGQEPSPWDRPSVTFRLTTARREALLSLGDPDSTRESPTAAIDLAIAQALDLRVERDDADRARRFEGSEAALLGPAFADLRERLDRIDDRLTDSMASANASDPWRAAWTLGDWAEAEIETGQTWVVGKARWIAAKAQSPGRLTLLVSLEKASGPHAPHGARACLVGLPSLRLGAMAAFDSERPAVLACWREDGHWRGRIHVNQADGTLGPALDHFTD